ncbi:MAG: DUF456 domain-containing protein [Muribaculaceae bacterium]|nr:DUF456 domain-containing protein [Muribaculaceae bacterium]
MATKEKFYERKNAEDIFFLSRNESTLPSKDTVIDVITNCVPQKYNTFYNDAYYNRYISKTILHYDVNQVYPNGYKISIYYNQDTTFLGSILGFLLICLGIYLGASINPIWGTIIGLFVSFFIIGVIVEHGSGEDDCERIVNGIREYERAHMMNLQ